MGTFVCVVWWLAWLCQVPVSTHMGTRVMTDRLCLQEWLNCPGSSAFPKRALWERSGNRAGLKLADCKELALPIDP